MEKMTTNIGRDAFSVLAVVSGSSLIASSPEIHDEDTSRALITSLRWSPADPPLRKGQRNSVVRAVENRSIHNTPLRFSACFFAMS